MNKIVRLSFIVCSYNGASRLRDTLAALIISSRNNSACEILVVDNASTDDTEQVINEVLASSGVKARLLYESRPGKANALKLAFSVAKGDLFSIVDDDNHVYPDWADTAIDFLDARPDVGLVGPRIIGIFPDGQPPSEYYTDPSWQSMLGILDLGSTRIEGRSPFGAGMTGRTQVMRWLYEHVGTYLSDRVGNKLSSCEDHEKALMFERLGWRAVYLPELHMKHIIPSARLNQIYIDRVMYGAMKAIYWLDILHDGRASVRHIVFRTSIDLLRVVRHLLLPVFGLHDDRPKRESSHWRRFFWARAIGGVELLRRLARAQGILSRLSDPPNRVRAPVIKKTAPTTY